MVSGHPQNRFNGDVMKNECKAVGTMSMKEAIKRFEGLQVALEETLSIMDENDAVCLEKLRNLVKSPTTLIDKLINESENS